MEQAGVAAFGVTEQGEAVQRVLLERDGFRVSVLTLGAVLQGVWLPGRAKSLTLGSDKVADYQGMMRHHGALIAPVINRFSAARAPIGGVLHGFEANLDGRLTLHSGAAGTQFKTWALVAARPDAATLTLTLPEDEGGFPGTRRIAVTYALTGVLTLRMSVRAETDRLTLMNPANHSYWNLDGTETWAGHQLRLAADHYLPTDADFAPTGEIRPVAGSPMDFRDCRQIEPGAPALDNCFCLGTARVPLREVLWLKGRSGVTMSLATTEAGVQLYDGRAAFRPGHGPYEGLAIETQNWPDAPNHPGFPSIELAPGEVLEQVTEWRFGQV